MPQLMTRQVSFDPNMDCYIQQCHRGISGLGEMLKIIFSDLNKHAESGKKSGDRWLKIFEFGDKIHGQTSIAVVYIFDSSLVLIKGLRAKRGTLKCGHILA